jgi:hypothetical protein
MLGTYEGFNGKIQYLGVSIHGIEKRERGALLWYYCVSERYWVTALIEIS